MQDDLDNSESPYFDWDNDRLFDESTRRLIDRIANDPRFHSRYNNSEIVEELAREKSRHKQECLREAAEKVFDLTVLPVLEAQALQRVAQALADSDWEALRAWREWRRQAPVESGNYRGPYADLDPRVLRDFTWRPSAASDAYHALQKEACAREEREVRLIVSGIPRRVRDLLVANRNVDRESLLEPWIEGASQSRRSWTAYYAQRVVREEDEHSVWDRYSVAVKILAGQGWSKKAIAGGIGISVGRIDGLLERTSGQDIADDDPLCDLVPALRSRGKSWRDSSLVRARKPKPFSRLLVDEKVALAEESTDPVLLDRLAKQSSGRISRALVTRYLRGDVGDNILRTIVSTSPWMGCEIIEVHEQRPMSQDILQDITIALAEDDANVLLDCDDATAHAAKSLGRKEFEVVLAFRESDTDALKRILTARSDSDSFWQIVDLLSNHPLADEMKDASSLLATALLHAPEPTDDVRLAKVGSQRVLGALVRRYRRTGDVGEDTLKTILATSPWMRHAMIDAHRERPLPKDIAIDLAADDARVLLDCDDATAHAAKAFGRKDFELVLAFRESNTDVLEMILTAGSDSESFGKLLDLLFERPLTEGMIGSSSLMTALLHTAERADDVELAAALRLIACQYPEALSRYVDEAKTGGRTAMRPEDIVEVALSSDLLSGRSSGIGVEVSRSNTPKGVEAGARALWEAADLTIEHGHARKVIAERGSDAVVLESASNIYVATADAICCFPNSRTKEYTYVHLRLTPASDIQFGKMAIRRPHELPALGYYQEMRKHPVDTDGPDVEAIVWPVPIQPAIFSLDIHSFDTGPDKSAGLIAVSGCKVAVVTDDAGLPLTNTDDL